MFEKIKADNGTLVIGGDFFDFWFDYGKKQPPGYDDILNQLDRLSANGVDIHYVLGNHDYWDFGYFQKKFNVYSRENLKCLRKNCNGIIMKKFICNRSTFFCNTCQK